MLKFRVRPGREIALNGKPFITIGKESGTKPVQADDVTHVIAEFLEQTFGSLSSEKEFFSEIDRLSDKLRASRPTEL